MRHDFVAISALPRPVPSDIQTGTLSADPRARLRRGTLVGKVPVSVGSGLVAGGSAVLRAVHDGTMSGRQLPSSG